MRVLCFLVDCFLLLCFRVLLFHFLSASILCFQAETTANAIYHLFKRLLMVVPLLGIKLEIISAIQITTVKLNESNCIFSYTQTPTLAHLGTEIFFFSYIDKLSDFSRSHSGPSAFVKNTPLSIVIFLLLYCLDVGWALK